MPANPHCPDCHGTGRRRNEYHHHCDRPLCAADTPTVGCECADDYAPEGDLSPAR